MTCVNLGGYVFQAICEISPLIENGVVKEFMPQFRYKNSSNYSLNRYGRGPFCRFRIPRGISKSGVYALYVGRKLRYIGKCENLSSRWNFGYGLISPRNCFVNGQPTNCRINNLVYEAAKANKEIRLYFYETDDSSKVEGYLIGEFDPEWNIKKPQSTNNANKKRGEHKSGEITYEKNGSCGNMMKPSFDEVWKKILSCEGEEFKTVRGLAFTYEVRGNYLIPSRTDYNIPKSDVAKA